MIRRIEFYGGPGLGKTYQAADTFLEGKRTGLKCELIQEVAKDWAYRNAPILDWDQLAVFNEQLQREYVKLRNGVDVIITDSPLFMNCMYAKHFNNCVWPSTLNLCNDFENEFPSYKILLTRNDEWYQEHGRYQDLQQAKELDVFIKNSLDEYKHKYVVWNTTNYFEVGTNITNLIAKVKNEIKR